MGKSMGKCYITGLPCSGTCEAYSKTELDISVPYVDGSSGVHLQNIKETHCSILYMMGSISSIIFDVSKKISNLEKKLEK